MPGTMTRFQRGRTVGATLRPADRTDPADGVLTGRHVALVGTDASPHVTGFPEFTSALLELIAERAARVSRPLEAPPRGDPDLVIAVLPGPGAAGAAVELADRHGVPLLVVVQGESLPPADDAVTSGARLAARLESTAVHRADRWAVTGVAARQRLVRLGVDPNRIDALPYWVSPARCGPDPDTDRAALRRRLGLPPGFLVVCPAGADTTGLLAVVSAAHLLAARGSDIEFVLVGRGPRLRALSASAATTPNVTIAELDDSGYRAALLAADLVLLSEAADHPDGASAGRLAAGLAAGRPMLGAVTDGGHLAAETAAAEGALITVAPDRPLLLADAVEVLRSAPQARAVMAAAARHYLRAGLGRPAAATALEQIAARTLNRPAGPARRGRYR